MFEMKNVFAGISFDPIEKDTYKAKGRYSVNIIIQLSDRIHTGSLFCDKRYYNTEQEKDLYIKESIQSYGKLAEKYNTKIKAIKIDSKYMRNIANLYNTLDELKS